MAKRIIAVMLLFIIVICCLLLFRWSKEEGFQTVKPLNSGELYIVHDSEIVPREELTLFLVTKENIILFYDFSGILNIYSLDGIFLYGLQVKSSQNGRGDIAHSGDYLYVRSRWSIMYVFDGPKLVHSFAYEDAPAAFRRINRLMDNEVNHSLEGKFYYYNSATNVIEMAGLDHPMETLISMPQKNPNIVYVGYFLIFASVTLIYVIDLLLQEKKGV